MGQYGHKFDSLIESKNKEVEDISISESTFGFVSVAYDEYMNRCSLLESCTEDSKAILEAQIEVLKEVSIKDIFSKLIDKVRHIFRVIKGIIEEISFIIKDNMRGRRDYPSEEKMISEIKEKLSKEKSEENNQWYTNYINFHFAWVPYEIKDFLKNNSKIINQMPRYVDVSAYDTSKVNYNEDNIKDMESKIEDFFKLVVKEDELKKSFDKDLGSKISNSEDIEKGFDDYQELLSSIYQIKSNIAITEQDYESALKKIQEKVQKMDNPNTSDKDVIIYINKDLINIKRLYKSVEWACSQIKINQSRNLDRLYKMYDKVIGKPEKNNKKEKAE